MSEVKYKSDTETAVGSDEVWTGRNEGGHSLNYEIMQIIIPNFHNMQILPILKSLAKSMRFQI